MTTIHKSTIQWPKWDDETKKKKKLHQVDVWNKVSTGLFQGATPHYSHNVNAFVSVTNHRSFYSNINLTKGESRYSSETLAEDEKCVTFYPENLKRKRKHLEDQA